MTIHKSKSAHNNYNILRHRHKSNQITLEFLTLFGLVQVISPTPHLLQPTWLWLAHAMLVRLDRTLTHAGWNTWQTTGASRLIPPFGNMLQWRPGGLGSMEVSYSMKVEKCFMDSLTRQVNEAVRIANCESTTQLKPKAEGHWPATGGLHKVGGGANNLDQVEQSEKLQSDLIWFMSEF
jgi:hypothetical protein